MLLSVKSIGDALVKIQVLLVDQRLYLRCLESVNERVACRFRSLLRSELVVLGSLPKEHFVSFKVHVYMGTLFALLVGVRL